MHVRYMSCISGRKLRDIALYAPRHQQLTCYLCKKYAATMISSMYGPSMSLYHLRVDATHSRPYTYCRASFTMVTFSDPKAYHILAYGTLLGCSYPKETDKPPKTVLTSRQRHQPTSSRHSSQVLWPLKPFQDLNSGKQKRERHRDREPARKVNNTYLTTTPPAPYNKPFSPLISASKPSSLSLSLSHGPASDWSQ